MKEKIKIDFSSITEDPARAERHNLWVSDMMAKGWKYGKVEDYKNKILPNIRPWDELSDMEKVADDYVQQTIDMLSSPLIAKFMNMGQDE